MKTLRMADLSKYFDYNATTPMSGSALETWEEAARDSWQNPSSLYREAGFAKQRLETAREDLADLLGIEEPDRIVFTSGATEANNAILRFLSTRGGQLVLSPVEHPCVEAAAHEWFGSERTFELEVDPRSGLVDVEALRSRLAEGEVSAVSVMAANNETGALQPWQELAKLCREHEVPFHSDAAQWIGKMPSGEMGVCDWLTGSGHKFGGGKGVGFLVLPEEGAEDFHASVGGPQEEGRRAGTENLPAILAMVEALEERESVDWNALREEKGRERDRFEEQIRETVGAQVIGEGAPRLWNTSMILLPEGKNVKWLARLSARGYAVSTGSACSAGKGNPSRVMAAMGLDFAGMGRVLRLSGGWDTGAEDWGGLADALGEVSREIAT